MRKENQAPQTERFVFRIGGKAGGGNPELLAGGHTGPPLRQGPDPWAAISHPAALFPCSARLSASRCHAAAVRDAVISPCDFGQTRFGLRPSLGFAHPLRVLCRCSQRLGRFALSRCGLGAWPGRFRFDSEHKQPRFAVLGLYSSLRSKLPYAPILRASDFPHQIVECLCNHVENPPVKNVLWKNEYFL